MSGLLRGACHRAGFRPTRWLAMTAERTNLSKASSEFHTWCSLDFGPARAEVEEILSRKTEHAGKQRSRHLLDTGVVFLDRVVEEAAAGGDLVLEIGQFTRQLLEIGVGLEVGIGFRQRDQAAERARELILRRGHLRRSLRRHRRVARLDDVVERAALMGGIALHGLDEVRDQVMTLLELHVDVGEGLVDTLAERDQPVIGGKRKQNEDDDNAEDDPAGRHGKKLLMD